MLSTMAPRLTAVLSVAAAIWLNSSAGFSAVAASCRKELRRTYSGVFAKNGIGYLTGCFVDELAYQGDQLGCGCSTDAASAAFVACVKRQSKQDIFYAIGFHCGAAHRKGWVRKE